MNELVTDIKKLQEETLKNLKNSKALNTVRAYKSDFEDFGLFCVKNGLIIYLRTKNCIFVFNSFIKQEVKNKHY